MARKKKRPRGPQLELAGDLSVAFANTAAARQKNHQLGVSNYAELLVWSRQAEVLSKAEVQRLSRQAAESQWQAKAAFAEAEKVRGALSRTFSAIASGKKIDDEDLRTVCGALARRMPALRLVPKEQGVVWKWTGGEDDLGQVLCPVLIAATRCLTADGGRPKIRQCAAKSCDLFFALQTARERVWCEMRTCGSREKSLRYYHRTGKVNRPKNWLYPD